MTERSEVMLAELLDIQRQQLTNQAMALEHQRIALEQQQVALARHQRGFRVVLLIVILIVASVLLPFAARWMQFLAAR